jgi:hypothetical protein
MARAVKRAGKALGVALLFVAAGPLAAQVLLYPTTYPTGPMEPTDPAAGIQLPSATPAEARAGMVWNLRSGLNVAALSCQFSPYLRTVDNYNGILAHHSRELAAAYTALEGYFRRIHGPRNGPRRFDDYSTQTYNNFSTFQAQYGFCQTAARISKEALSRRKGDLHLLAAARLRELRNSLRPAFEAYTFTRMPVRVSPISLVVDCRQLPRRERRACEREQRQQQRQRR